MTRERERQNQRLLNVARACRETPYPEHFHMGWYQNLCGTPACAMGNYAFRRDLQKSFKLNGTRGPELLTNDGRVIGFSCVQVLNHFGITLIEAELLFDATGCGGAKTPIEAAEYIEDFVKERRREEGAQS